MSAQPTSPSTPKPSYAAAVGQQAAVNDTPHFGVCTRATTRKMAVNTAAASLRAAQVPTKGRTYTVSSIMAAASAIIARASSPNMKVRTSIAKMPSPNTKVASPQMTKVSKPSCEASVLTLGASTMEEQMHEMRKMLEQVLKDNEERNKKIEDLQKEVVSLSKQKVDEVAPTNAQEDGDHGKMTTTEITKADAVTCNKNQLEVLIANVVKSQLTGNPFGEARYTKPYSKRIDSLRMPQGYQPPKFQQFDGKGNPKQHVAHFVETCSNAGTEGDLLVKQFVRSLKGVAFDWYTDLKAESIDSWGQMEDEFFNRFYSTRRVVSMSELTNTKQWHEEPVVDYINRWRTLCLECKDRISETSAVEMCIDGMNWELLYILKGNKPKSFQELATRAHDMEITLTGHKTTSSSKAFRKMEHEEIDKATRSSPEEAMVLSTNNASLKGAAARDFERTRPTLEELQAKKYPFLNSDLPGMLDDLLEKGVVELPEAKHPDEINKTNNPKYCRYHRMVGHKLENCITLKELIVRLVREGRIVLDTDETVETNHASTTTCDGTSNNPQKWSKQTIQFGTLEPVKVWTPKPHAAAKSKKLTCNVVPKRDSIRDLQRGSHHPHEDDEWTLVTRRKSRKQVLPQPQPVCWKKKRVTKKRPRQTKGKKKPKSDVKSRVLLVNLVKQIPPVPITLGDFFPEGYLNKVTDNEALGAINGSSKEEPDDEASNTKCAGRPPIQWYKGRIKSRS